MSYQVIARKWRPQIFSDLVGQGHITQTLINALKGGRIHHTLLFTGPRGTGKTSSARILAKALRCTNAKDFIPCNECVACTEIASNSSPDVREIDAASNNGVDAIRELRETVGYLPASGKYKVYIIDEVHMLSTSAFNALLKTLEEPPENVVFIMATTEVHKIPQTILSRCQRYDFRRIPTRQIADRLKLICENEGVSFEEDALWVIARQGDGSMRDSQSLLDQVITFANGSLTQERVVETLGLTDRTLLLETLVGLIERSQKQILAILSKLSVSGFEPPLFAQDLLESIRNLLLVKVAEENSKNLLELPDSEMEFLKTSAGKLSEEDIHMLFDMALKTAQDVSRSSDPRIVLEVGLLRMASAPKILDLQSLLQNKGTSSSSEEQKKNSEILKQPEYTGEEGFQNNLKAPSDSIVKESVVVAKKKAQGENLQEKWINFVDLIREDDAIFAAKVENIIFSKELGNVLCLAIPPKLVFLREQVRDPQIKKKLQGYIDSFWGDGYSFEVQSGKDTPEGESAQSMLLKKQQQSEQNIRDQIESNSKIVAARKIFNSQILSVTDLNELKTN